MTAPTPSPADLAVAPCPNCNGRGYFADDMMGSSFHPCPKCMPFKGAAIRLMNELHDSPHPYGTHRAAIIERALAAARAEERERCAAHFITFGLSATFLQEPMQVLAKAIRSNKEDK